MSHVCIDVRAKSGDTTLTFAIHDGIIDYVPDEGTIQGNEKTLASGEGHSIGQSERSS